MTTALQLLDSSPIERAAAMLAGAQDYVIDNDFMFEAATDDLKAIKGLAKQIETDRKALTKPLDVQKKTIMDHYRPADDYLAQAESILKKGIARYTDAQAAEQRAMQLAAARATDAAQAALADQAKVATAAGDHHAAAELELAAALTTVAAPQVEQTRVAGISTRAKYSGRVDDELALIRHIMASPELVAAGIVMIDHGALNRYIQATKGAAKLPGVTIETGTIVASRAA